MSRYPFVTEHPPKSLVLIFAGIAATLTLMTFVILRIAPVQASSGDGSGCSGTLYHSPDRDWNWAYARIVESDTYIGYSGVGICQPCRCPSLDQFTFSGVAFFEKTASPQIIHIERFYEDEDQVYCYLPPYNYCPDDCHCLQNAYLQNINVDLSSPGTTEALVEVVDVVGMQGANHCRDDGFEAEAKGYVHVYEIILDVAARGDGLSIDWEISPSFDRPVCGDPKPSALMLSITSSDGKWVATTFPKGWSGSAVWDGQWMIPAGERWDKCTQVTVTLGGYMNNYFTPQCGPCQRSAVPFTKQVCWSFNCPCDESNPCCDARPGAWSFITGVDPCEADNEEDLLLWQLTDVCDNHLELWCEPSSPEYASQYKYKYNGNDIGLCVYNNGQNIFKYRMAVSGVVFHSMWHRTADPDNSGDGDEGTLGKYDWIVNRYCCPSGQVEQFCREDPYQTGDEYDGTSSDCE